MTKTIQQRHFLFIHVINGIHRYPSIPALAKAAKVSEPTLYSWISSQVAAPRSDTLFKVAKALGYEVSWKYPQP